MVSCWSPGGQGSPRAGGQVGSQVGTVGSGAGGGDVVRPEGLGSMGEGRGGARCRSR